VAEQVHAAGGLIFPQLWHVGMVVSQGQQPREGLAPIGPQSMTQADIDAVIEAFAKGARDAQSLGFDGVELHGAHGYLIDQFFWDGTNVREDEYGGSIENRARFGAEIIAAIRARVGAEFPILLRFSQWKQQDYTARLMHTPEELERFLKPLVAAGVDMFHCSTRRFWEPEFPETGSDMNLAGWTKKITGLPTISVGSVSLNIDFINAFFQQGSSTASIDRLLEMMARGDFDLIAIGRALLVNPDWPKKIREGHLDALKPYDPEVLQSLY